MYWYRVFPVAIVVVVLFGLGANQTLAGEPVKYKASGTSINTKWHEIEVGDTDGHVIAVFENKQVWVSEITGETAIAHSRGTIDLNKKSGQGTMRGYNVTTWENGDKRYGSYEGKLMGKGQWEGTYTDMGGTGKFDGCSGGGIWRSKSLGPGISHLESEGERTFQSQ
jgi:hypothetical protein